jgi:hypothetical protein
MGIQEWIWSIALKKGVARLAMVTAAFLASAKAAPLLQQWGVTVDPDIMTGTLTATLTGALEVLRNWLKVKIGIKGI